jgi:multiple sugar transport system substrate-binding protein
MSLKPLSRRSFLGGAAALTTGILAAACQPKVVEKIVEKEVTKVVEVEKLVKETVVVAGTPQVIEKTVKEVVTATPAVKQAIELRVHHRITEQENALDSLLEPRFKERFPHITLKYELFPGGEFYTKVQTMQAGGTLGDVTWLWMDWLALFHGQGMISPLDELIASEPADYLDGFYPGCVDALNFEGKQLGNVYKASAGLAFTYYNQSLIEEAGLEAPTMDWTHEDEEAIAKAVQKLNTPSRPVYGHYRNDQGLKSYTTLLRSFGGEFYSEDWKTARIDTELAIAAMQRYKAFFQDWAVAPLPTELVGGSSDGMWTAGLLGLICSGSWTSITGKQIGDNFKWMVVPQSKGPGGVGGSNYQVDAYALPANTKFRNEAWEYIKLICGQEAGQMLVLLGGTTMGRPDAYNSPNFVKDPWNQVISEVMAKSQRAYNLPWNWRPSEMGDLVGQRLSALIIGEAEIDQAWVDQFQKDIDTVMAKPRPI